jgi:pimeloyl-ACP methyl ester carboxylesterase
MRIVFFALALLFFLPLPANCQSLKEITYTSSADGSQQPAMFFAPDTAVAVPLVVALHTWSGDYKQDFHKAIAEWCIKNGWAYIHPNFRGPNVRPEATCSELVVKDIMSAVQYAKHTAKIDPASVYLIGTSGGGYAALVMAGRHPEAWSAVSAWVPICDLRAWYFESETSGHRNYSEGVAKSCGGAPGDSPAVDEEYRKRSPAIYLANAKGLNLHIDAGIGDKDVPVSHSLNAFNLVADPNDRLSEADIREFVEKRAVPPHLQEPIADPSYGQNRPLFRRASGQVTVTIFQGGHELLPEAAMARFQKLHDEGKGKR